MNKSKLIIISGAPGSGKSTLAKQLSDKLNLPVFSKDMFKELIFEHSPAENLEQSKTIGKLSINLLYSVLKELLNSNQSLIIESNFRPEFDNEFFSQIQKKYNPQITQLHCTASTETLISRFLSRIENGRHEGHHDLERKDELLKNITEGFFSPLKGNFETIVISTEKNFDIDFILKKLS